MRISFNNFEIKRLYSTGTYKVKEIPYLYVNVNKDRTKSFIYRSSKNYIVLGRFELHTKEEILKEYKAILFEEKTSRKILHGTGTEKLWHKKISMREVMAHAETNANIKPTTMRSLMSTYNNHIAPCLQGTDIKTINTKSVLKTMDHGTTGSIRNAIKKWTLWLLSYAHKNGMLENLPYITIKETYVSPPKSIPNFEEMKKIYNNILAIENLKYKSLLLLAFYTGARKSNVCTAHWDEFNLNENIWTIPANKTKSSRTYHIPIHPVLKEQLLLYKASRYFPRDALFLNRLNDNYINSCKDIIENLKLSEQTISMHTFRHNLIRTLSQNKVHEGFIKTIIGHSGIDITSHYLDRSNDNLLQNLIDSFSIFI